MEEDRVKFQELQAVVMAGGKGSRLMDLTNQIPKCLLQVGTYPMVWYPLHMLEQAGFEEVILVVAESQKSRIYNTLTNKYSLKLRLDVVGIPGSEDWGTAESLRFIAPKIKTDVLVVSCDLITNFPLYQLADIHRTHHTAITALFAQIPQELIGAIVPGHKGKQKIERDFIGLDSETSRLVCIVSEADVDDNLTLRKAVLKRHPHIVVHSKLMDAHLYIMRKWVLDYLLDNKNMATLKGELVPYLVKKQFTKPAGITEDLPAANASVIGEPARNTDIFAYAANDDNLMVEWANRTGANMDPIRCYGVIMDEGFCIRVNNLAGYCEGNRQIYRQWPSLAPDVSLSLLHADAVIKNKTQIGSDCIVGEGSEVSDKVSIKRCVIGQHCKIADKVKLANCIIMSHVTIQEGCTANGSILCDNVTLEERSEVKDCIVTYGQTVTKATKHVNEVIADRDRWLEI